MGTTPDATSAADPPDDPPAETSVSQGFRVVNVRDSVEQVHPNSGMVVVAIGIRPVARYCAATAPFFWCGVRGNAADPSVIGRPATGMLSLNAAGTPANAPVRLSPARRRARAKSSRINASSVGFNFSARTMAASTASLAEIEPDAIASATPVASRSPRASSVKA